MVDRPVDTADDFPARMMTLHEGLTELFHRHQVALLDRDLPSAREWLARFRDALHRHADDEERFVLPIYAARGGAETDSPPEQFLTEHKKLRERCDTLTAQCAALGDRPDDRALLALLDAEAWYKSLLDHHDVREARALYPRYAEWATPTEQREAAARLALPAVDLDPIE
jgi:hemerythrin-like domain-containing protein